ncbi:MAG TPA: type 1 glutamine amidotransferase [Solirubrobacteraceae bacterium]|nr:type 1 glutamine amidotransferase [Solirubrobacteraceae bacterium]
MQALIIQHDLNGPAGHVIDWLAARGADQDVWLIGRDSAGARDPLTYDLIVSLGSEHAAYDDALPWLEGELGLLRAAFDGDVPVLGICFGGQLLARALGGRAMRGPHAEIGWVAICPRDPAFLPAGPWLQWHYDTFTPPPGAVLLAESPAAPQAYTIGLSLGLQFHPEVTPDIVGDWVAGGSAQLLRAGLDGERLMAETRERDAENRARAWRLLDLFQERVAAAQRISKPVRPSGSSSRTSTLWTSA